MRACPSPATPAMGKSSWQSGLTGHDETRSGRPEPMALRNSDSQASEGRKKSKQDFSRPHDLLSQYRGRKIGPVLRPLHSLTDYREPLAFRRLVQRAAKNIGMPFRTFRTFTLRGNTTNTRRCGYPERHGCIRKPLSRSTKTFTASSISQTRKASANLLDLSTACRPKQRGPLPRLPCA